MAKKAKKNKTTKKKLKIDSIPDLIHSLVEKGANSTEEIHREIAALPTKILENFMPATAKDVGKIQHRSIGAVYDAIREVNDEVERFAKEILKEVPVLREQAREVATTARRAVKRAQKAAKKTVRKTARKKPAAKRKTS